MMYDIYDRHVYIYRYIYIYTHIYIYQQAVIKATSLEHGPPKEKHLQMLLNAVGEGLGKSSQKAARY